MAELVFASYAIFLLTAKINNLTTERQLLLGKKKYAAPRHSQNVHNRLRGTTPDYC